MRRFYGVFPQEVASHILRQSIHSTLSQVKLTSCFAMNPKEIQARGPQSAGTVHLSLEALTTIKFVKVCERQLRFIFDPIQSPSQVLTIIPGA